MEKSLFVIMQQIDPRPSKPYRIIEMYQSSDGIRTRFCDGVHQTLAEAIQIKHKREEAQ